MEFRKRVFNLMQRVSVFEEAAENELSFEKIITKVKELAASEGFIFYITNDVREVANSAYLEAIVILKDVETGELISTTALAKENVKTEKCSAQNTIDTMQFAAAYAVQSFFGVNILKLIEK